MKVSKHIGVQIIVIGFLVFMITVFTFLFWPMYLAGQGGALTIQEVK